MGQLFKRLRRVFSASTTTGFTPHDVACDKYWACEGGVATLKTCGNGLAFDDGDVDFLTENCDYYHNVDCSTRPERQKQLGGNRIDVGMNVQKCNQRYLPRTAHTNMASSPTLMIVPSSGHVGEERHQADLNQQDFLCPAPGELVATSSFTRHAHPDDCRQYYVCLDGVPREYGCPIGTVFQIGTEDGLGQCSEPELVPGCEQYYGDLDLGALRKSQLLLGQLGLKGQTGNQAARQPVQSQNQAQSSVPRVSSRVRPQTQVQPELLLEEAPLQ
ncbi:hypothetical protein Anas_09711 [Armadillidium nasatum]|uniref:Chitin-binding type-2 domain-containing protein n=1 Tax=Armadillidium nasatum TaxID=96803 RepID=A0A5N5SGQ7_9CRUS|nr:hypothetical protein Anas_09711 [Armadillidium nasatum]